MAEWLEDLPRSIHDLEAYQTAEREAHETTEREENRRAPADDGY